MGMGQAMSCDDDDDDATVVANADQLDADSNGIGDVCDTWTMIMME